jgi:Spy/CpxP family protein refolding chaperone
MTRLSFLALAALLSAPALAQTPPPPHGGPGGPGMQGGRMAERAFPSLSPEGRKIMTDAMRETRGEADRAELRAARDRVGTVLSADRLDVNALRQAMDAERKLVDTQQQRRQEAMIAAFQKLSAADRKAFVADAKAGADRMRARMVRRGGGAPS